MPDAKLAINQPSRGWPALNLHALWEYRELILFFAARDISIKYRQTLIGGAWAVAQPIMLMAMFTVLFGRLAKFPSEGVPYTIFALSGLLPWQYCTSTVSSCASSMIGNPQLITKVYFPRLVLPVASCLPAFVDFAITFVLLLVMMLFYGVTVKSTILLLPLFFCIALATSLGTGIWFATLNVRYRDVKYVLPFLLQVWMLASPVAYSISIIPSKYRVFYSLNPLATAIEGFRWALLGGHGVTGEMIMVSVACSLFILLSGTYFCRFTERTFADRI